MTSVDFSVTYLHLPIHSLHISMLELRAVWYGLLHLLHVTQGKTIRLMSDNIAAVAFLRNQRGILSLQLYQEVRDLLIQ